MGKSRGEGSAGVIVNLNEQCKACAESLLSRNCGMYRADCQDCEARAIARSPIFFDAARTDAITPAYRDVLQAAFGDDWKSGHEKVKRWVNLP